MSKWSCGKELSDWFGGELDFADTPDPERMHKYKLQVEAFFNGKGMPDISKSMKYLPNVEIYHGLGNMFASMGLSLRSYDIQRVPQPLSAGQRRVFFDRDDGVPEELMHGQKKAIVRGH